MEIRHNCSTDKCNFWQMEIRHNDSIRLNTILEKYNFSQIKIRLNGNSVRWMGGKL